MIEKLLYKFLSINLLDVKKHKINSVSTAFLAKLKLHF